MPIHYYNDNDQNEQQKQQNEDNFDDIFILDKFFKLCETQKL